VIDNASAPPYKVEGGDSFEALDKKVRDANPDATWREHIKSVGPAGPSLFDMFAVQVDTDLDEDSASDTKIAVEICKAYHDNVANDGGVVVNGLKFTHKTQVDGSVKTSSRSSKMADSELGDTVGECSKS
jgi:hypothetical protein